jgi:hypothetical protein
VEGRDIEETATIDVDSDGPRRAIPRAGAADLGPLRLLPGTWTGRSSGWRVLALPRDAAPPGRLDYSLLLGQFTETLTFSPAEGVPDSELADGCVGALDCEQLVTEVAGTGAAAPGAAVHREPGLLLHLRDRGDGPTIARLATVPHGDAALAPGYAVTVAGPPRFEGLDLLPVGVPDGLANPYLAPYRFFHENPFFGNVEPGTGFPGFDPTRPHVLLQRANQRQPVARTTVLLLDTDRLARVPQVHRANATRMQSIFWINELVERDAAGRSRLQLQYLQVVDLEFYPRRDGRPGRIGWPHVRLNTLEKVST